MKNSFSACIAILSASPSDNVFVESASFRGLMNKLSSFTKTNNENPQQTTTANIDEVVHVDLDSHAIALAEKTDIHPWHDPEQVDRHLSYCDIQVAATEFYTPPDPPACCTEEAWHPTYAAGWTNGYCQFVPDCNSPSYSSELACCKGAYAGQVSGVCLNSLPSPPTGSPTDLGEVVFYPDYSTDWANAICINDRPWPFGPNDRPTYTNMKDCCDKAYGGQVSKACITAYYASFPNPPTGSPTEFGMGTYYPDYDLFWVDGICINTKPVPSGRPTYPSLLACCQGAYAGQTSQTCLTKYYESFPNPPTGSPTQVQYYPDYETKYEDATCLNTKPFPFTPGSRPLYNSQLECCKGAYRGQTSNACLEALPDGLRPTSSPTGSGGAGWYNNQNGGDFASRVCTQETPKPQWGTSGDYDTLLECCNKEFASQTSKACYCEATQCASGTGVCEDNARTFDANVGCESCSGDFACIGATGNIGNVGNPGCKDCASCVGTNACINFGYNASSGSKEGGTIGTSSCAGVEACAVAFGTIGDESCLGVNACLLQSGTIGDQSCTKGDATNGSCSGNSGIIGDGSCTEQGSCFQTASTSKIGNGSCKGENTCRANEGEIGNDSCNAETACFDGSSGLSSSLKIGSGSCNAKDGCNALTVNVGNNSCNRSDGCNLCQDDVPSNQCNGGTDDECPASCNLEYCEATQCASGTGVCEDGDSNAVSLTTFDANVGCESCSGDYACMGATGSIGNVGNPGCKNCASCVGSGACINFGYDVNNGDSKEGGTIGTSSCVGQSACVTAFGTIGDESCRGIRACRLQSGTIGDQSCTAGDAGLFQVLFPSCSGNRGIIGDGSCTAEGSCFGADSASKIGNGSCKGTRACALNHGEIGNDSCNAETACSVGTSGLRFFTLKVGSGSCNAKDGCNDLQVNVGNNSCNRSAGCNGACTRDIGNNECNGGTNDVCPCP